MVKRWKNIVTMAVCLIVTAIALCGTTVQAEEDTTATNQLMKIKEAASIYEQPDENAEVLMTLEAETPVIVKEVVDDTWNQICYQDTYGYIESSNLVNYADEEVLAKEYDWIYNDDMLWYAEIMEDIKQKRQARIWGSCIAILIVAIFGVGIVSAIRSKRNVTGKESDNAEK